MRRRLLGSAGLRLGQSSSPLQRLAVALLLALAGVLAPAQAQQSAPAQPLEQLSASHRLSTRVIDRTDYRDRLRAMWLGEVIANWTGRITEGCCCPGCPHNGPFLTDDDWGGQLPNGKIIQFILHQDPWLADDDTDIEYVYQYLLEQHGLFLTSEQIAAGWIAHINDFIWVSNQRARELMGEGVLPPSTGMGCANRYSLRIDAQLTTEMLGAYCPGLPAGALQLSHLPIRTTAEGHAAHAAQAFAVMYSLATVIPGNLSASEQALWLVERARGALPETSKAVDIIDFVVGSYLADPQGPWEACRDAIYVRYQLEATQNGFVYRGWTESSVNFATAIMALLYGELDYKRTVQIATLSGWDSDNPAATMGGLLGLMLGYDELLAQFPGVSFSDRFNVEVTRDNLPDHLPDDPEAQDTFTLLAERQLLIADQAIEAFGGRVDPARDRWIIPAHLPANLWEHNPLRSIYQASANNQVRLLGGSVSASASVTSDPPGWLPPIDYGSKYPSSFTNGYELNFSGVEFPVSVRFYSSQNAGAVPGDWQTFTVTYSQQVAITAVRFIEGNHFDDDIARGGYFSECFIELRIDGNWIEPMGVIMSEPLDAERAFQAIDFILAEPMNVTGMRLTGRVGGLDAFVTIAEIDALLAATP